MLRPCALVLALCFAVLLAGCSSSDTADSISNDEPAAAVPDTPVASDEGQQPDVPVASDEGTSSFPEPTSVPQDVPEPRTDLTVADFETLWNEAGSGLSLPEPVRFESAVIQATAVSYAIPEGVNVALLVDSTDESVLAYAVVIEEGDVSQQYTEAAVGRLLRDVLVEPELNETIYQGLLSAFEAFKGHAYVTKGTTVQFGGSSVPPHSLEYVQQLDNVVINKSDAVAFLRELFDRDLLVAQAD